MDRFATAPVTYIPGHRAFPGLPPGSSPRYPCSITTIRIIIHQPETCPLPGASLHQTSAYSR